MRLKQRPIKTSRHKSVTLLNDTPQTSFGDAASHLGGTTSALNLSQNSFYHQQQSPEFFKDLDNMDISDDDNQQEEEDEDEDDDDRNHNHTHTHNHDDGEDNDNDNVLDLNRHIKIDNYNDLEAFLENNDAIVVCYRINKKNRRHTSSPPTIASIVPPSTSQTIASTPATKITIPSTRPPLQTPPRASRQTPAAVKHETATGTGATTGGASSGGEFPCDEPGCGKFFPSLRKLRHHKVVHSNEFPYTCQFAGCAKRFKRKFGIDLHSTTHFDLDPDMYKRTSNNSSMQIYGRRMQYNMCKQCDAKFKTVHEYQNHMLAHGKEPFKCLVKGCGQSFSIWKSFQKHRASHYFNYYCRMDPQCDHHTSNLQLLKLHIYCCHFNRILPENAKPTSRDQE